MSRIIVLGMGLMGPTVAKDCAEDPRVKYVRGCDIDDAKLRAATNFVANRKFETVKLDVASHDALVEAIRDYDTVVNASAAKFSIPVLEAAMEVKVNVVDLAGAAYPLEGDIYKEVEKAGITAIPGCGVDPGLIEILSGRAMDLMQKPKEVYFACGGLPKDPKPPLGYKIVFGGTKMPIRPGKVPVILDGKQVMVDRYDDLETISVEGYPDMEAFYDGYPSSLLKSCLEKGVKTFKGKTIRYKGFVEKLKFLLDLGVISSDPLIYHGKKLVPIDFFNELVYPMVKFDEAAGDRDITVLLVRVAGRSGDVDVQVRYDMVDVYDEEKKITSMAKTTGYTAAIVARMVAGGDIPQKGVQWPVHVIRGELFEELLSMLRTRGVEIKESATKTRKI